MVIVGRWEGKRANTAGEKPSIKIQWQRENCPYTWLSTVHWYKYLIECVVDRHAADLQMQRNHASTIICGLPCLSIRRISCNYDMTNSNLFDRTTPLPFVVHFSLILFEQWTQDEALKINRLNDSWQRNCISVYSRREIKEKTQIEKKKLKQMTNTIYGSTINAFNRSFAVHRCKSLLLR